MRRNAVVHGEGLKRDMVDSDDNFQPTKKLMTFITLSEKHSSIKLYEYEDKEEEIL